MRRAEWKRRERRKNPNCAIRPIAEMNNRSCPAQAASRGLAREPRNKDIAQVKDGKDVPFKAAAPPTIREKIISSMEKDPTTQE
jgi:hypothetical protein